MAPSTAKIKIWAQAIREMGYPFASLEDATVSVSKVREIKTDIKDLDNMMELVTNLDNHIIEFDFNIWCCNTKTWAEIVNTHLRAGNLKTACQEMGIIVNISPFSERTLKVYLQDVTPEYYTQLLNDQITIAKIMYPELIQYPQTGKELSDSIGLETKKLIENGLQKIFDKYPNKPLISGIFNCISSDNSIDIYDRIVESVLQRSGCYLLYNNYGNLSSCKIQNRTCKNPFTRGCRCNSEQLAKSGTSNTISFMTYLVTNKGAPDVDKLIDELNEKLTNKLIDLTSINNIVQNAKDQTAVYYFQTKTYNKSNPEPFSPCAVLNSTATVIACDVGDFNNTRTSSNNNLDYNYAMQKLAQNSSVLDSLVDISLGTGIDFLYLNKTPTCPECPYNKKYSTLVWFFIILFILLFVGLLWFVYAISNIKQKNYNNQKLDQKDNKINVDPNNITNNFTIVVE